MSKSKPIFRFAPSPNGRLHRGHALSALLNWQIAARNNGVFLLRIEDIDFGRSRNEYIRSFDEDLNWMGLDWPKPVRRQSENMQDYARAFRALSKKDLVYPCFCSRRDVERAIAITESETSWPCDPDGSPLYPGTCRHLTQMEIDNRLARGELPTGRLNLDEAIRSVGALAITIFDPRNLQAEYLACDPSIWGDIVLVRRDTPTSYHLSVVVDDALQGVTHVVRGKDLEFATSIHVLLQKLLALPSPAYWHHSLMQDENGQKLSKSRSSLSLREEIENGLTRDILIQEFCKHVEFADLLNFQNIQPEGR